MIRHLLTASMLAFLFACTPQSTEKQTQTFGMPTSQDNTLDSTTAAAPTYTGSVTVEVGGIRSDTAGYSDDDVVAKIPIEYAPESDAVRNYSQLEPSEAVSALLDRPFLGLGFQTLTIDDKYSLYRTVSDALGKLGIPITESQEVTAHSAKLYDTVAVSTPDISVELLKVSENLYQIVCVEVPSKGSFFQSALPFDLTVEQVEARLGEPNFKKKDGSVFIYSFFSSLKQLNIVWVGDRISKLQYLTFNGI